MRPSPLPHYLSDDANSGPMLEPADSEIDGGAATYLIVNQTGAETIKNMTWQPLNPNGPGVEVNSTLGTIWASPYLINACNITTNCELDGIVEQNVIVNVRSDQMLPAEPSNLLPMGNTETATLTYNPGIWVNIGHPAHVCNVAIYVAVGNVQTPMVYGANAGCTYNMTLGGYYE